MRYRIVLLETIHSYEGVVYREWEEHAVRGKSMMANKTSSIAELYNQVVSELSGHSAWVVKRIEEAPLD
jgi:hypothetical protein